VEVALAQRVLGRLGHDRLVGLAVDHDLPAALTLVVPVLVLEDREPPLLEHVDGGVDVAGQVVDEVLPGEAHEVLPHVADEFLRRVLAPLHAHVHVDGRQAHGHGAGALDGRLLDQDDAQAPPPGPVGGLEGRAAAGHASADDEDVALDGFDRRFERHLLRSRDQALTVGRASMWRYFGSPMSSWVRNPASGGSGSPSVESIEPQAVVRIGYLNRLISPLRYWMAHMIESVPRSGVTREPIGITSA